jgi:hypothetical protein
VASIDASGTRDRLIPKKKRKKERKGISPEHQYRRNNPGAHNQLMAGD